MDEFPWRKAKTEPPDPNDIVIAKIRYVEGGHYCIDSKCWCKRGFSVY